MSNFVLATSAPKIMDDGCIVIDKPNFTVEIEQCIRKKPKSKTASINYLREIVATIGMKYAPETFNPLSDINLALYKGTPCGTIEQTQAILTKAFSKSYPQIFDLYVDYHIKHRPRGTRLIYFLGDHTQSSSFQLHGIDVVKPKDVDVVLGKKTKKIVGKPAITKDAAVNK